MNENKDKMVHTFWHRQLLFQLQASLRLDHMQQHLASVGSHVLNTAQNTQTQTAVYHSSYKLLNDIQLHVGQVHKKLDIHGRKLFLLLAYLITIFR